MPAAAKLVCPDCDREFRLPAHLARHRQATHNSGGRKVARAGRGKRKGGRSIGRNAAPPSVVASAVRELRDARDTLQKQLALVDRAIAALEAR